MYISQAFKSLHEWWRYLVGLIIIVIAVIIGQIPFTAASEHAEHEKQDKQGPS